MVRNELSSPTLKWLSNSELEDELIDIVSEIKLLTGAILHTNSNDQREYTGMLDKQLSMIRMFLMSAPKFAALTTAEVRHAFYLNQQGVLGEVYKHYNKELNAEFIGDVLLAYLKYKKQLWQREGEMLKNLINPPKALPPVVIRPEEWQKFIQEDYERYRAGEQEWIFNTTPKYFYLRKAGYVCFTSKAKWLDWYRHALIMRERSVATRKALSDGQRISKERDMAVYEAIRLTGIITRGEHQSVLHLMRRLVYLKFFDVKNNEGCENIFSKA